MSKRKLLVGLSTAGVVATGFGATGLAGADVRTLDVTLQGGKVVRVTVDAPAGTPVQQIALPDMGAPVIRVAEVGAPATPPADPATPDATATSTTDGDATPPAGTATSPTPPASAGSPDAAASALRLTDDSGGDGREAARAAGERDERERAARRDEADGTKATRDDASGATTDGDDEDAPVEGGDVPPRDAPGFSEVVPGPAAVGVPNFFIDKFRIPPFLLPIYQAAGMQYGVRWEVLAAINEIETDYGRNLSVSSAGAL
ncbi:MAG: hypothetical protein M0P31_14520, partial [Solirubrobacteraceae bacterium]|nr:hypothetical protein [Solirubrobacteraceae bacterium]